jgi:hypothetical protein
LIGWGFIVPVYPKANINTICTTFSTDSPIDNNIQLCLVITTWQEISKATSCKYRGIWKELCGARPGEYSSIRVMERVGLYTLSQ